MHIREIDAARINETVRGLCMIATTELGEDVVSAVKAAHDDEPSELGRVAARRMADRQTNGKE